MLNRDDRSFNQRNKIKEIFKLKYQNLRANSVRVISVRCNWSEFFLLSMINLVNNQRLSGWKFTLWKWKTNEKSLTQLHLNWVVAYMWRCVLHWIVIHVKLCWSQIWISTLCVLCNLVYLTCIHDPCYVYMWALFTVYS